MLSLVVLIALIMDFATGKVSNKLIIIGLLLGFFIPYIQDKKGNIIGFLLGAAAPVAILLLVFMIGGIGAGDIKLFAVIGGFIGVQGVLKCMITAFVIGAVISFVKILVYKNFFLCFHNIIRYLSQTYNTKKFQIYEREKSNTIHFTLPMFISILIYIVIW
ncbi:A24 family peptidase [Lachnotalea glycerini]|uniref:A24 family peptidase n=1 Tax=Lachnotalea glycerini TaxID=1763509 RepID=UPI002E8E23BE|nr:prepilin peptidase [Lachnotalea glycerini]